MSDEPVSPESPTDTPTEPAPAATKPRSPVERAIVWGMIAILGVLLAFEASAKFSYDGTLSALQARINELDESGAENADLPLSTFRKEILKGSPSEEQEEGFSPRLTFRWKSLFKEYSLVLILSGDEEPFITTFETSNPPEEPEPEVLDESDDSDEGDAEMLDSGRPPGAPRTREGRPRRGGGEEGDRPAAPARPALDDSEETKPVSSEAAAENE